MRKSGHFKTLATACVVMLAAFASALSWSCRGQDQIAPEGSTIHLAANPTTIVLDRTGGTGSSELVATVSSSVGAPLKDQDVRFTTTAGSLFTESGEPGANIPIRTDDLGNAFVRLVTGKNTTVTARSGTATGDLALDVVVGNLSGILLNQVFTDPECLGDLSFQSCNDVVCLEAQAVDDSGAGIDGVLIVLELKNNQNSEGKSFSGVFTPNAQAISQDGGFVRAKFKLGSNCFDVCAGDFCTGDIIARTQSGSFVSNPPLTIDTNIE